MCPRSRTAAASLLARTRYRPRQASLPQGCEEATGAGEARCTSVGRRSRRVGSTSVERSAPPADRRRPSTATSCGRRRRAACGTTSSRRRVGDGPERGSGRRPRATVVERRGADASPQVGVPRVRRDPGARGRPRRGGVQARRATRAASARRAHLGAPGPSMRRAQLRRCSRRCVSRHARSPLSTLAGARPTASRDTRPAIVARAHGVGLVDALVDGCASSDSATAQVGAGRDRARTPRCPRGSTTAPASCDRAEPLAVDVAGDRRRTPAPRAGSSAARLGGMRRWPHSWSDSAIDEHAMPVNTTANTASAVSVADALPGGRRDRQQATTARSARAVNGIGRSRSRVRAVVHDLTREQHRARERQQLAAPEVRGRRRSAGRGRRSRCTMPADHRAAAGAAGCTTASIDRREHHVQAGDERRRRRRRVLQPDGLRRVPAEEEHAGDEPGPHEQPPVLAVRRATRATRERRERTAPRSPNRTTRYANGVMSSSASWTSGNVTPKSSAASTSAPSAANAQRVRMPVRRTALSRASGW